MNLKTILLAACALIQQVIALSQTNPLIKYVPDDASMVVSINLLELGHKISGESFRQSFIYREMMKDPNPELNAFLADPSALGLDLSNDIFLVTVTDTSREYPGTSVHIFGLLKDEAVFTNTMKKLLGDKNSINVYGSNKIIFTENGGTTLAWNREVFVLNAVNGRSSMMKDVYGAIHDSTRIDFDKKMDDVLAMIKKMQRDLCFELLAPHPQNSFSRNIYFINLVNTAGDIKMWNNGTPNPALNKILPIAGLTGKLQALSGKNKTAVISFENGMISAHSRNYPGETLAALYKKYPSAQQHTELVRRLPKGKLLGMINISYNPEMAGELMRQIDMKELTESIKKIVPFDFSGMNTAFKNNMMFAVVKSDEVSPTDSITQKLNGLQLIFALPIADKSKFLQLKAEASRAIDSLKNSEMGGKIFKDFNPAIQYNDSLFVLSSSPDAAMAFLNNNGSNPVPDWLQSNINHPMVMNINMKEILALVANKSHGELGMQEKILLGMFDQMIIYGGGYENGSLNTTMEFRFGNPNENALKQLFDMINAIAGQSENKREKVKIEDNENTKKVEITLKDIEIIEEKKAPPPPPPPKMPVTKPKTKIKD